MEQNPAVMEFLLTRRSRPQKTLTTPVPSRDQLTPILTAALRSPDHGKLEPWRLIVLERGALQRLGDLARSRAAALELPEDKVLKGPMQFDTSHLCVAVIEVQKDSEKVPAIEQTYSAGAVCLALLNAAQASGWGANWLTGWPAHDRGFVEQGLDLAENERVAGLIHIGTETSPPPDRPRPDLESIVTWQSA
ncbi:nitroreductase [Thalassobius vesicularis]|uniref:Putative NAD(P)H nitroreductase n=1 Tax=Thalassobius vesicularis TaxID=1294297 RepID=A0A4V3UZD5_9RHOB|nr:nitroreductase [Thalassobius vesicularis]THD76405.1 nitroreductase [Thalassobius vesicularis]